MERDSSDWLLKEDPGLAVGIVIFIAMLTIGALFFIMFDPAAVEVFSMSSEMADHSEASNAIETRSTIWGLSLFYVLLASSIFLIARAVRESSNP